MSKEPGLGGLRTCMGSGLDSGCYGACFSEVGPQIHVVTWNELYLLKLSSHHPLCFVGQRDPARHGIYKVKPMGQEQPFCPPCGPIRCVIRVAATQTSAFHVAEKNAHPASIMGSFPCCLGLGLQPRALTVQSVSLALQIDSGGCGQQ